MARESQGIAPGWYKDPAEPTTQRWWDGEGWVGDPLPADATPPPGPPPASTAPAGPAATPTPARPDRTDGSDGSGGSDHSGDPRRTNHADRGDQAGGSTDRASRPTPGWLAPRPSSHGPDRPDRPSWSPGQPPPRPHGLPLATLGSRLVARLVDIGLIFALNVLVNGWFVYRYVTEIAPVVSEAQRRMLAGESLADMPDGGDAQSLLIVILIIAAALWFAYEVPAVANTGQTPGKRLLGIKVVRLENDQLLGFGRSFRRWNTMGLPTLVWWCGIGFLLQLVDVLFALFDRPLQQTLHDKSAHTAVVAVTSGKGTARKPAPKEDSDVPTDPS